MRTPKEAQYYSCVLLKLCTSRNLCFACPSFVCDASLACISEGVYRFTDLVSRIFPIDQSMVVNDISKIYPQSNIPVSR